MPSSSQQEIAVIRQAVRGRWNVPQAAKQASVAQLYGFIQSPELDAETKINAIKTLAHLDSIDLKEIEMRKTLGVLKEVSTADLLKQLNGLIGDATLLQQLQRKLLPNSSELEEQ